MFVFKEGAGRAEINRALGFEYKGKTDLTRILIFLLNEKIVYREEEAYIPDRPSKLFFNFNYPEVHYYREFTPKNAIFKATKEKIDGIYYYELVPLN